MKQLFFFAFCLTLVAIVPAKAQYGYFELGGDVVIPQGSFGDNVKRLGGGLHFNGGYQFTGTPFVLGVELGFVNFGTDTRVEPWSSTIPDLKMNVDNNYNLAQGMLIARFQPPNGNFKPFVEGVFGFNYFFTETSVSSRSGSNAYEPIASDTNYEDTTYAYGLGGGVHVQLYQWTEEREKGHPRRIYLTLSSRYTIGGEAEYLTKGSITITPERHVIYNPSTSRTNMLKFSLGVTFQL